MSKGFKREQDVISKVIFNLLADPIMGAILKKNNITRDSFPKFYITKYLNSNYVAAGIGSSSGNSEYNYIYLNEDEPEQLRLVFRSGRTGNTKSYDYSVNEFGEVISNNMLNAFFGKPVPEQIDLGKNMRLIRE